MKKLSTTAARVIEELQPHKLNPEKAAGLSPELQAGLEPLLAGLHQIVVTRLSRFGALVSRSYERR